MQCVILAAEWPFSGEFLHLRRIDDEPPLMLPGDSSPAEQPDGIQRALFTFAYRAVVSSYGKRQSSDQ